ncbi:hypothetical protein IBTHAUMO2_860002 [Nitrosopumilaceae archaeon]|nr:hypothetical protein IBTHAUMO2_860002 [Nitrosopumilaceae archaeon]
MFLGSPMYWTGSISPWIRTWQGGESEPKAGSMQASRHVTRQMAVSRILSNVWDARKPKKALPVGTLDGHRSTE